MGVLENLVAPVIKDVMGNYFSNFNADKLDIGMGNVELLDMLVRPGLLDDYGIPLKLVYGKVGRVYLEFGMLSFATNWSGRRDVVVLFKDVYLLLAPPTSVKFQDDTQEKKDKKRKALEALIASDPALTVTPVAVESGANSLIAEIANNIKITVENVHIRYEDELAHPGSPFACGITLKALEAISTDSSWKPNPTGLTELTFFKLVTLDELGVYWNSHTGLIRPRFATRDAETASVSKMSQLLNADNKQLKYLIGPLSGEAKAMVTMKPNRLPQKFSKPVADVILTLDGFNVDVTDEQFHDTLLLMETLEDTARRKPYLAFRPFGVPYEGNSKKWWTHAYKCIRLGVEKRVRIYDANYLVQQQRRIKAYELAYANYRQRVGTKEATDDDKKKYEAMEDDISNQDILIVRKRVAMKDKKVVESQETKSGWLSNYKVALDPVKLKRVLEEKMSPEELKQLQQYISFEPEDADAKNYPAGYAQMKFAFGLPKFAVNVNQVQGNGDELNVLELLMNTFSTSAQIYPAEKGLSGQVQLSSMTMTGVPVDGVTPSILRDLTAPEDHFVVMSYAKNPLNKKTGQHITIKSERVEVIYDSATVQKLIDCFTWPSGVELAKTKAAVGNAMENAKNMSVTGLKEMIENTDEIYVDIFSKAPYFMLPSGGSFKNADTIWVLNSGNFMFTTTPRERTVTDGHDIENVGSSEEGDVRDEVLKLTYNQYVATYSDIESFVALKGEDIKAAVNHTFPPSPPGTYHMDRPVQLFAANEMLVNVNQSIIKDDPRFPKIKLDVSVPLLDFTVTDFRLLKLATLLATIPIPKPKPPPPSAFIEGAEDDVFTVMDPSQVDSNIEDKVSSGNKELSEGANDPEHAPQFTNIVFHLEVKLVKILLMRLNEIEKSATPLLELEMSSANLYLKFRSFGLSLDATCVGITAAYLDAIVKGQEPGSKIYFIQTPQSMNRPLVKLHAFSISEACPPSRVGDMRQKASAELQSIDVILHKESLEGLLLLADRIFTELKRSAAFKSAEPVNPVAPPVNTVGTMDGKATRAMKALGINNLPNAGDILIKGSALIADISVSLTSEQGEIAKFYVGEIVGEYEEKAAESRIFAQIKGIEITNMVKPSYYSRIMDSGSEHAFLIAAITMYKNVVVATNPDIEVQLKLNCPPILCLGENVASIVDFGTHLLAAVKSYKPTAQVSEQDDVNHHVIQVAPTVHTVATPADLYKNDKKLSLEVNLNSPKLIFVKGPMSPEAFVADFGSLTVTNKLAEVTTAIRHSAIRDDMHVTLEGLSLERALMDTDTQEIKSSVYLLDPVTVTVDVQRSLSAWCKQLPLFEVSGELQPTALRISTLDIEVSATCILNYTKNINKSYKALKATAQDPEDEDPSTPDELQVTPNLTLGGADVDKATEAHKIGLTFRLVQLGLAIYQRQTVLEKQTGVVPRDKAGSLAEFIVNTVVVGMKLWDNEDLNASLIIQDLLLRDARPLTGEITDFLLKREDNDSPNDPPVVQLVFGIEKMQSGRALYKVESINQGLTVIVYLEFLKQLLEFGLAAVNSIPKEDAKVEGAEAAKLDKKPSSIKLIGISPDGGHLIEEKDEKEAKPLPLIKGKVIFSETEYMLLESTKSAETNAIIIYGNSTFNLDSSEERGTWGGGQWAVGIITAKYSPDKPKEQVCDVLEPVTLKVTATLCDKEGVNVAVELTEAVLHINAGTLLLVQKFVTKLQGAVETAKKLKAESENARKNYANVWDPRDNSEQDYWFLDLAALTRTVDRHKADQKVLVGSTKKSLPQSISLKMSRGIVLVEAGISTKPTPMLMADGHVNIDVKNFSSNLSVQASLGGVICYNNISKGTWEYLVEPNEGVNETDAVPWKADITVIQKPPVAGKSALCATISSEECLELTVSKSSIELLTALGQNFSHSLAFSVSEKDIDTPPYIFSNDTGTDVHVSLDGQTGLKYTTGTIVQNGTVIVKTGEALALGLNINAGKSGNEKQDRTLNLKIPEFQNFSAVISVGFNGSTYFQVGDSRNAQFGMLVDIKGQANFSTMIVARSIVQLSSQLSVPVEVFAVINRIRISVGTLKPFESMNLPFSVMRNAIAAVGLVFVVPGFQPSTETHVLGAIVGTARDTVTAKPITSGGADGKIRVIGTGDWTRMYRSPAVAQTYRVLIKPPLVVNNFIPLPVEVSTDDRNFVTVEPGTAIDLLTVNTDSANAGVTFKLRNYLGTTWTARLKLQLYKVSGSYTFYGGGDYIMIGQINSLRFTSADTRKTVYFRFRPTIFEEKLDEVSIFCPYWMVNRTGLTLAYQGESTQNAESGLQHAPQSGIALMGYDVDGKSKCKFSVEGTAWSEGFTLDTPMTVDFTCHGKSKDYEVVVSVELSPTNLTKTIILLPKHAIINSCPFDVVIAQVSGGGPGSVVVTVPAGMTVPFWPNRKVDQKLDFVVKVVGTDEWTTPCRYEGVHNSLLKLENKYGGVCAKVSLLSTKGTLTICQFDIGEAPVLLVNDTRDLVVEFNQQSIDNKSVVPPRKSVVFTWDDLSKPDVIEWNVNSGVYSKTFQMNVPSSGEFKIPDPLNEHSSIGFRWTAFPSGLRTIFVLTDRPALIGGIDDYLQIGKADNKELANPTTFEANVEFEGIGLSIVDDKACRDLLYVCIHSTPPMWEATNLGGTIFRTMTPQASAALEKGCETYRKTPKIPMSVGEGIQIDYSNFQTSAPKRQQLQRRSAQPGIAIRFCMQEFSKKVSLSISSLQIDNQLEETKFPQLLVAAPVHKSATLKSEIPPPLLILDFKDRSQGGGGETINGNIILQKICVAADSTFLKNLITIFESSEETKNLAQQTKSLYEYDQKRACMPDSEYFKGFGDKIALSGGSIVYYELVKVFPLKIQVSATLSEDPDGGVLSNMLLGVGAGVVSVTKAELDIDGMDISQRRWTRDQLEDAVISYYETEVMKQFYKLILGLDLLGNPTRLLGNFGSGVKALVMEPWEGAMDGNFVEGVTTGVGAYVGGTLGGIYDALGNISGQLGKISKGFSLFGVHQFFTGTSSLLLGIGGALSPDQQTTERLRPPRVLFPDRALKPFTMWGTMGDTVYRQTLHDYPDAGTYIVHYVCPDGKGNVEILLLAQGRVYCAACTENLNSLHRKFSYAWKELDRIEKTPTNGVVFKELKKTKGFRLFGNSGSTDQVAMMPNPTVAAAALQQCKQAKLNATGISA